jgi:hypothetical protein
MRDEQDRQFHARILNRKAADIDSNPPHK